MNPDFSQVEADAAQLDVNERFALFFPEKRPFFLEGADLFATHAPGGLHPHGGRSAVGLEAHRQGGDERLRRLRRRRPAQQPDRSRRTRGRTSASLDDSVHDGVLRYRRDVGANSSVGVLYTDREGDGYHNRVAGLDGFFRLSRTDTLSVQALLLGHPVPGSRGPRLRTGRRRLRGNGLSALYQHASRDWFWYASWDHLSPEFRADSGFVPRVDKREGQAQIQRQFWGGKDDRYTQINAGFSGSRLQDYDGRRTDQRLRLYGNVSGPLQSFVEIGVTQSAVLVDALGRSTSHDDLGAVDVYAYMQPNGVARFQLIATVGEVVDFTNNRPADTVEIAPGAELKLGPAHQRQARPLLPAPGCRRRAPLRGQPLAAPADLQLQRPLLRARHLPVPGPEPRPGALHPASATFRRADAELFTQLLFSYKLNPQTVLFLGYSDNRLGTCLDLTRRTGRSSSRWGTR